MKYSDNFCLGHNPFGWAGMMVKIHYWNKAWRIHFKWCSGDIHWVLHCILKIMGCHYMCKLRAAWFFITVSRLTLGEKSTGCLTQWCRRSKHLNIQLLLFENCTVIWKVHSLLGKLGLKVLLQMTDSASFPSVSHFSDH